MKDEFDNVTPDMFERPDRKAVSKITGKEFKVASKTYGEEAAGNKPEKAPAKPAPRVAPSGSVSGPSGGGASGGMGTGKMNRDISKLMKKGGKVSSASSRADGCAVKGKTKGRFV